MFYVCCQYTGDEFEVGAYLCPHLQHILEGHARVGQFALEEHHDVVVVLLELLSFRRL